MLLIDTERHEITLDGKELILPPAEFAVLAELKSADGRVLSRDQIAAAAKKTRGVEITSRVVDQHISRLRRRLGPKNRGLIRTITNKGYKLAARA